MTIIRLLFAIFRCLNTIPSAFIIINHIRPHLSGDFPPACGPLLFIFIAPVSDSPFRISPALFDLYKQAQEDLEDTRRNHELQLSQDALSDLKGTLQDEFDEKYYKPVVETSEEDVVEEEKSSEDNDEDEDHLFG